MGKRTYDGPFEGVPDHLKPHLLEWINDTTNATLYPKGTVDTLAMRLRVPVSKSGDPLRQLIVQVAEDDDLILDCVEGALQFQPQHWSPPMPVEKLQSMLAVSGSKYTVAPDGLTIVDAVSEEVEATKSRALSVQDEASEELTEAWVKAYGRSPDASDAWDHAIKAVETLLRRNVESNNSKATLGSMIAVLNNKPGDWQCVFPGKDDDNSVENFTSMLRLIWPNPDRHGSGGRKPSLEEARAVVTLAATLVQWHREGQVVTKR